jgi:putative oxidoreductase
MSLTHVLRSASSRVHAGMRRCTFAAPLLARLTVGYAFVESGWGKLQHLDAVAAYFTELGIPWPGFQSSFVSCIELVCGSLVLIGLGTRLAAVPLIGTMLVALLTAKASDIAGFSDLIGTIEFCYAVLLAGLVLAGPGAASLDEVIARRTSTSLPSSSASPASLA